MMPENFCSAIAFTSSSVTCQDHFLLPALAFFWHTFPLSICRAKHSWVAKHLLSITKVRWDKSHPERLNNLSGRKSQGSAGISIQLSPLAAPHLLSCHPPFGLSLWAISAEHSPVQFLPTAAPGVITQAYPQSPSSHLPFPLYCQLCPSWHKTESLQLHFTL